MRRIAVLVLAGGCGLFPDLGSLEGDAGLDATNDGPADASFDAIGDVGVIPDVSLPSCDGACGAPYGFTPVLFALDQKTSCPTGTTTLNGAADPSLGAACACDCKVTQPPSCSPIVFKHDLGDTPGMCPNASPFTPVLDAGCYDAGATGLHAYWSIPPPPVDAPGTCTSTAANNPTAASAAASRICIDTSCQSTCSAPSGFMACFIADGNVACPNGLSPHHVGNVSVSCNSCSACSVGGSCGGTVTLYQDNACATALSTIGVDASCVATNGTVLGGLKYAPAIVGETCTPGTASGTVSLQQELTVCCP